MQNFCHICGAELSQDEKFCPWCGKKISERPQRDSASLAQNPPSTKQTLAKKAVKFKVSKYRDAVIGIVAISIIAVFVVFILVNYIKNNTYEASVTSYLNILNGKGDYKDLKTAVSEELLKTAAEDYYNISISDIKKGTERLISVSAETKEAKDFKLTVKNITQLDEIDLLAYKHSKADFFGQGYQISAEEGYTVEVLQTFSDSKSKDETKTFTVLRIGSEWCTYDALGLICDAALYGKMTDDEYENELKTLKGSK